MSRFYFHLFYFLKKERKKNDWLIDWFTCLHISCISEFNLNPIAYMYNIWTVICNMDASVITLHICYFLSHLNGSEHLRSGGSLIGFPWRAELCSKSLGSVLRPPANSSKKTTRTLQLCLRYTTWKSLRGKWKSAYKITLKLYSRTTTLKCALIINGSFAMFTTCKSA